MEQQFSCSGSSAEVVKASEAPTITTRGGYDMYGMDWVGVKCIVHSLMVW